MTKFVLPAVVILGGFLGGTARAQDRTHLPMAKEVADRIGGGNWVRVQYTLSDGKPGRLEGTITCENHVFLSGFAGGATVRIHDAKGNVLFTRNLPTIGVNATLVGNSTRAKHFTFDIPEPILDAARSCTVRMWYADGPNPLEEAARVIRDTFPGRP